VATFSRFLSNEWGLATLNVFLLARTASQDLQERRRAEMTRKRIPEAEIADQLPLHPEKEWIQVLVRTFGPLSPQMKARFVFDIQIRVRQAAAAAGSVTAEADQQDPPTEEMGGAVRQVHCDVLLDQVAMQAVLLENAFSRQVEALLDLNARVDSTIGIEGWGRVATALCGAGVAPPGDVVDQLWADAQRVSGKVGVAIPTSELHTAATKGAHALKAAFVAGWDGQPVSNEALRAQHKAALDSVQARWRTYGPAVRMQVGLLPLEEARDLRVPLDALTAVLTAGNGIASGAQAVKLYRRVLIALGGKLFECASDGTPDKPNVDDSDLDAGLEGPLRRLEHLLVGAWKVRHGAALSTMFEEEIRSTLQREGALSEMPDLLVAGGGS